MGGYLLDTNIVLVIEEAPERLSANVRAAIEEGPAWLSVISHWEVAIKFMKGKLDVADVRSWWAETLDAYDLRPLLLRPEHVTALCDLAPIHQDPFDRGLIAQAIAEDLTLVTNDDVIAQYASERFRVLSP